MAQFIIRFEYQGKFVKDNSIRPARFLQVGKTENVFFDTQLPSADFDLVTVYFWNCDSDKTVMVDDLKVEMFD